MVLIKINVRDEKTLAYLQGVKVVLSGPVTKTAYTVADGFAYFYDMPTGSYNYEISFTGYSTIKSTWNFTSDTTLWFTMSIAKVSKFLVTVADSSTGNAIEGAKVTVAGIIRTTDYRGYAFFEDVVRVGEYYTVTAEKTNYQKGSYTSPVLVEGGSYTIPIRLVPIPSGAVGGYVRDSKGNPIYGAVVTLTGTTFSATTNAQGYYLIDNVPEGSYTIKASKSGYEDSTAPVSIRAGATLSLDLVLKAIGEAETGIKGTVTDQAGNPIYDAEVLIPYAASTRTDSAGRYKLLVSAGPYGVIARKSGYKAVSQSTVVTAGSLTTLNFTLVSESTPTGSLTVTVKDESGILVDDAMVTVDGVSDKTIKGVVVFMNLTEGAKTVTVSKDGYDTSSVSVTVLAGKEAKIEVTIKKKAVTEEKVAPTIPWETIAAALLAGAGAYLLIKGGKK